MIGDQEDYEQWCEENADYPEPTPWPVLLEQAAIRWQQWAEDTQRRAALDTIRATLRNRETA